MLLIMVMKVACHTATSILIIIGGSICESVLSVHDSHRMRPLSYHYATYSGGSICEISVKWLVGPQQPQIASIGLSLILVVEVSVKLLILLEVSVKVAWRSTRAKIAGTELLPCYLFWWKYM